MKIHLPNFWQSLPCVAVFLWLAKVDGSVTAAVISLVLIAALATVGAIDIIANHYRAKLTSEELAMAS